MLDENPKSLYYHPITRKLEWRCKYYSKKYAINSGTRLIRLHLILVHNISEKSPRQERIIKRQRTIEEAIISRENNPRKRRLIDSNIALDNSKYYSIN
jgi:hypothetical protein